MKYTIISNINIEQEIEAESVDEALENLELPDNYLSDSLELVEVFAQCGNCSCDIEVGETRCERCKKL